VGTVPLAAYHAPTAPPSELKADFPARKTGFVIPSTNTTLPPLPESHLYPNLRKDKRFTANPSLPCSYILQRVRNSIYFFQPHRLTRRRCASLGTFASTENRNTFTAWLIVSRRNIRCIILRNKERKREKLIIVRSGIAERHVYISLSLFSCFVLFHHVKVALRTKYLMPNILFLLISMFSTVTNF
jgi:hypothetical protein